MVIEAWQFGMMRENRTPFGHRNLLAPARRESKARSVVRPLALAILQRKPDPPSSSLVRLAWTSSLEPAPFRPGVAAICYLAPVSPPPSSPAPWPFRRSSTCALGFGDKGAARRLPALIRPRHLHQTLHHGCCSRHRSNRGRDLRPGSTWWTPGRAPHRSAIQSLLTR